jgi:hypothetical protein
MVEETICALIIEIAQKILPLCFGIMNVKKARMCFIWPSLLKILSMALKVRGYNGPRKSDSK